MTLTEIKKFATENDACESQLNKFNLFLELGDELSAWQTVLGNYSFLYIHKLPFEFSELEILAHGVGKIWHNNGELCIENNYKNGLLDGLYRQWYSNGQLHREINYKCGIYDGSNRKWYSNGKLWGESIYKNGRFISENIFEW
jgi:hypothetical protein